MRFSMKLNHLFLVTTALLLSFSVGCSSEDAGESTAVGRPSSGNAGLTTNSDSLIASSSTGSSDSLAKFSADSAKNVALHHANTTETNIQGYECTVNDSNGNIQYDISFWVGTIEYLFYISGSDGSVLYFTTEFHQSGYVAPTEDSVTEVFTPQAGNLTESQAKAIVAKDAGVSESSLSNFTIKEKISGSLTEYEMTFIFGSSEYYYTILATSGTITYSKVNNIYTAPVPQIDVESNTSIPNTAVPDSGTTDDSTSSGTTDSTTGLENSTTDTTTPDTSTTVTAPNISSSDAKNIALRQTGATDSSADRLSITENKDSSGSVTSYQVSYFYEMQQYSYTVSAISGAIS